ncbi:hypothetical protein AB0H71_23710 [Nocardia sp. NPDC050697]|uniref:hypothetical protein n=1 Tax=Nocardia sp. NPDC050697 TaxID=3155158 RepID=UPI0033E50305
MARISRQFSSFNSKRITFTMHVALVVLGAAAAMMVAYSPQPMWGAAVLALVLGVEVPVALANFFGVRAAA